MATNGDTGRLTIFDLLFCMAIAAVAGAALFAIFTDDPGKWATKNGRSDWLGFSGAIIGSAVTGMSIYAAWRHGSKQLASQRELENWKIIFDILPEINGSEHGLRNTYQIVDLIYIYLIKDIPDSELFTMVAAIFGDEAEVGRNTKNAVDTKVSNAPEDIRQRLTSVVSSCQNISKISQMIEAMPMDRQPEAWRESARINRANIAIGCSQLLKEIAVRIDELDNLRFLVKEGRARAVAHIRQTAQARK